MKRKRRINSDDNSYLVKYNSDPELVEDNHKAPIHKLRDTDIRYFGDVGDAIVFMCECTSPITTTEDLLPELRNKKGIKYVVPDSHIIRKHSLIPNLDKSLINGQSAFDDEEEEYFDVDEN